MKNNVTDELQVMHICDLASMYAGLEEGEISSKSRLQRLQLPRMVVGVVAREYGIHYNSIASILKRDRCSVYYYEDQHAQNYAYWHEYRELFNKVYNAYSEMREAKYTFKNETELKNHLIYNNIKENILEGKVKIVVTSGKIKTTIKTNYREFSNTLKKISDCLVDYNHTLDVQI